MIQKRLTLSTRPFQSFFNAADDLLNLAKPYHDRIQSEKSSNENTNQLPDIPRDVWQFDKSLSIGSFVLRFTGLEAFVSCVHDDFNKRQLKDLPEHYFISDIKHKRNQIITKPFDKLHLATRVYFIASLCLSQDVDPQTIFDIDSENWKQFVEVVNIRNSYSHAKSQKIEYTATKTAKKLWTADDSHPDNFWPLTKTPKDHRIFNYEVALELNQILNWTFETLKKALDSIVDDVYLGQETMKIHQD